MKSLPRDPIGWHTYGTLVLVRWDELFSHPVCINEIADALEEEAEVVAKPFFRFLKERNPVRSSIGSAVWFLQRGGYLGHCKMKLPRRRTNGAIRYVNTNVFWKLREPEWVYTPEQRRENVRGTALLLRNDTRPKQSFNRIRYGLS